MYISKIFKNDKEKAISILNSQEQLNEILEIGLINGNLAS